MAGTFRKDLSVIPKSKNDILASGAMPFILENSETEEPATDPLT
jgi:hypothetical protein